MSSLYVVLIASCLSMFVAWAIQHKIRNAGVVDVCWAFGMMLAGTYYAYIGTAPAWLRATLASMVVIWFARLGLHILLRVMNENEDGRYRAMRESMGGFSTLGFLVFFQVQAGFVVLLSLPFFAVANTFDPSPIMVGLGVLVAVIAFVGEASADHQLRAFRLDPENKGLTCREGWWKYSRHPNYFFEWLHWFAYPLMGFGGQYGHWLWLAPLVMLLFLLFFTGIPFAEQQALRSRPRQYRAYQQDTSMFFLWPPNK